MFYGYIYKKYSRNTNVQAANSFLKLPGKTNVQNVKDPRKGTNRIAPSGQLPENLKLYIYVYTRVVPDVYTRVIPKKT